MQPFIFYKGLQATANLLCGEEIEYQESKQILKVYRILS